MDTIHTPQLTSVLIYWDVSGQELTLLFLNNVLIIREFAMLIPRYKPTFKQRFISNKKVCIYKFF